jgi:hypothetical protein
MEIKKREVNISNIRKKDASKVQKCGHTLGEINLK